MSTIAVTDKRGGVFQVVISFSYGECDRLPYNAMRKVKARIEQIAHGGITSTAEFNIRNAKDAANFVEVLDLFGEDGSFVHGSGADPEVLNLDSPPEDDISGIRSAPAQRASRGSAGPRSTKPSPRTTERPVEVAEDLEVEKDADGVETEPAELEAETEVDANA